MKKCLFLLPALLMGMTGCSDDETITMQFDYIFTAQPVVAATNSAVFKNVQNDFAEKSNGQRIVQASVFVKKTLDVNMASVFLSNLETNIEAGINNPALIKAGIETLGSNTAQQAKFGVPGAMAMKVTNQNNGFSLGYEYTKDIMDETSSFVHLINPKIGELTENHVFNPAITDSTVDTSSLKILAPTGAPSVGLYYMALNENFETTSNPATALIPMFKKNVYDIIIAPTQGGLMQVINNNAEYQIAASITFGNMYIVSMGTDFDGTLNQGDRVLYFQQNDLPGKVFNYLYGDLGLTTFAVNAASDTKMVIENNGILKI